MSFAKAYLYMHHSSVHNFVNTPELLGASPLDPHLDITPGPHAVGGAPLASPAPHVSFPYFSLNVLFITNFGFAFPAKKSCVWQWSALSHVAEVFTTLIIVPVMYGYWKSFMVVSIVVI